jgi:Bacterial dnaA  protein
MTQIGLPFDWPAEAEKTDFLVSESNRAVADHIEHWARWPVRASLLVGPRKSGRSLIGRVFASNTGGRVIDDAEAYPEGDIFHAWNHAQETRVPLLIIAESEPQDWPVRLADLKSRFSATPMVTIGPPDTELCAALLVHIMARRGVALLPEVANYIAVRMERHYVSIQRIVDALDQASLSHKRGITVPFARDHLGARKLIHL